MVTEILDNTGTWMPWQVRAVVHNLDKQIEQLQRALEEAQLLSTVHWDKPEKIKQLERELEKEQTRVKAQKLVIVHLKDELAGAIKND